MPYVELPDSGLVLGPATESAINDKSPRDFVTKQIIRITFADSSLYDALTKSKEFRLKGGSSITFSFGDEVQEVISRPEAVRHELYETLKDKMHFAGMLSHQFEIRKIEKESLDDAADLIALRNQMSALSNQKKSKTTMLVDTPLGSVKGAKLPASKIGTSAELLRKKQQTSAGAKQSTIGSTVKSARPSRSDAASKAIEKALRGPLIFLLALGPDSEQNLALRTHAPLDLCRNILQKTANRTGAGGHWQLVDDVFRELDLWLFSYATQADREKAISNAKAAFERLRLPADAEEWTKLLAPASRGKVPPPIPASLKPKIRPGPKAIEAEAKAGSGAQSPATSDKNLSEPMIRTTSQPPAKMRKVGEKDAISRIIANKGKPQKEKKEKAGTGGNKKMGRPVKRTTVRDSSTKATTSTRTNSGPHASKFISSEFVDSSSDPDSGIIVTTNRTGVTKQIGNSKLSVEKIPPAGLFPGRMPGLLDVKAEATKGSRGPSISPKKSNSSAKTVIALGPRDIDSQLKSRKPSASPITNRNGVSPNTFSSKKPSELAKPTAKKERAPNGAGAVGGKKPPATKTTHAGRTKEVKESKVAGKGLGSKEAQSKRSPVTSPTKPSPLGSSPPINATDVDDRSSITPSSLSTVGSTPQSPADSITVGRVNHRFASDQLSSRRRKARDEDLQMSPTKRPRLPDMETLKLARKYKMEYSRYEALYNELKTMFDSGMRTEAEDALYEEKWQTVYRMQKSLATLKAKIWELAG